MSRTLAEVLARYVEDFKLRQVPEPIVKKAKLSIMDTIGVIVRGIEQDSTQAVLRMAAAIGGREESSVAVSGLRLPALHATLVNGAASHSLELDDHTTHKRSLCHPGVVSVPPALALAESRHQSGTAFLEAVILGYDITSRIDTVVPPGFDNFQRGFHGTAVTGTFGAAALSGRLLGLDADRIATAFGISGSLTAGSFEYNASGAWTKRLHAGNSGKNGMMAALLAAEGFTGPHTAFEGRHGFFNAYMGEGNYDLRRVTEKLGEEFEIRYIMYKPFACMGVIHAPLTATRQLVTEHDVKPWEVERVVVSASTTMVNEVTRPEERKRHPQTTVDAQFSLPYALAVMICRRGALVDEFSAEAIKDPEVLAISDRVEWFVDPEIDRRWPQEEPSTVTIHTKDGRKLQAHVEAAKGSLEMPMSEAELKEKFRLLTEPVLGEDACRRIVETVENIEQLDDAAELAALLVRR